MVFRKEFQKWVDSAHVTYWFRLFLEWLARIQNQEYSTTFESSEKGWEASKKRRISKSGWIYTCLIRSPVYFITLRTNELLKILRRWLVFRKSLIDSLFWSFSLIFWRLIGDGEFRTFSSSGCKSKPENLLNMCGFSLLLKFFIFLKLLSLFLKTQK